MCLSANIFFQSVAFFSHSLQFPHFFKREKKSRQGKVRHSEKARFRKKRESRVFLQLSQITEKFQAQVITFSI